MVAHAWTQGAAGIAADIAGYTLRPWGFDPADVKAETLLLYGGRDPIAGEAHAHWWQSHLPSTRLEIAAADGHMLVIPSWRRVLKFLTE
jgi:pimeloyl-ACP methyl ester carboxylesterase